MKRVAVLRGGPSDEYEVSMKSGASVLEALKHLDYVSKDIVITRKGEWLENGVVRNPEHALEAIDIAFIALHGRFGEDGQVQKILQRKHIPFTGSRALPSAIAFNKTLTKQTLHEHKVKTPKHFVLKGDSLWSVNKHINDVYKEIGTNQLFVKPNASGSSVGAGLVDNQDALEELLDKLLPTHGEVLIEEYIQGKEATVGVIEGLRDQELYVLPPVEIIPPSEASFFDNNVKYNGQTEEICPGRFTYEEKKEMSEIAVLAHTVIGCEHYSRSDFLVKDGHVYFLEINTLPGLTTESLLPKAAESIGVPFNKLVEHLIETAKV